MPELVLPKLVAQHGLGTPPRGQWESDAQAALNKLGGALVSDVDADFFDVDAIPDVWARPLLFEMALYDAYHPLHRKVEGEWRGLAALIALKNWRGFPLSAERVSLDSPTAFTKAAKRLAPTHSLFSDTAWDRPYVFLFRKRPVGMTSPTTLFATGVHYRTDLVPWFNGRVLCDPLRFHMRDKHEVVLNREERSAVAAWLGQLKSMLVGHPAERNPKLWGDLLGVIQSFEEDLGHPTGTYTFQRDVLGMSSQDAFRYLDEVPQPPTTTANESHVLLRPSRDPEPAVPLIVLDPAVAEQWHMPPRDIAAWGTHSLEAAAGPGLAGQPTEVQGQALDGAEWRKPGDFFLDTLHVFNGSAFVNVRGPSAAGEASPVLPVTEEVLRYLDGGDLAQRTTIVELPSGGYEVRLRLPLAGPDGTGRDFVISRRYEGDRVVRLENPPVLEVWPDFVAPDWDEYYTYFNGSASGALYGRPFAPGDELTRRREVNEYKEVEREVTKTRTYPNAMVCFDPTGATPLGILLPAPPQTRVAQRGGRWRVGIDFGTTNTTVYVNDGGVQRPLAFPNRLRPITKARGREAALVVDFLPSEEQPSPFRTFYRTTWGQYLKPDSEAVLDGHILYLSQEGLTGHLQTLTHDRTHTDLKWVADEQDRIRSKRFLEQLVLQVRAEAAAEGVSEVEWTYSVPTSFSPNQRAYARAIWQGLAAGRAEEQTESLATAAYFLDRHNAAIAVGTAFMDVGGMSSDLAVWQENRIQLQTSLRLASRSILVETLAQFPEALQYLFGRGEGDEVRDARYDTRYIESGLAASQQALWSKVQASDGEPWMRTVRQLVVVGFGGLLHYLGLLVRHLVENGSYEPELPSVYVGGNGARMLHWLSYGQFDERSPAVDVFDRVMRSASGIDDGRLSIRVTPDREMKHEVSYGLVTPTELHASAEPVVLAGEAYSVEGQSMGWSDSLDPETFRSRLKVDRSLPSLRGFLDVINEYARSADSVIDPVPYDDDDLKRVADRVQQALQNTQARDVKDIDPEPLFITALKAFLDEMRGKLAPR